MSTPKRCLSCQRLVTRPGKCCDSPTCDWWKCTHCHAVHDKYGHHIPGKEVAK